MKRGTDLDAKAARTARSLWGVAALTLGTFFVGMLAFDAAANAYATRLVDGEKAKLADGVRSDLRYLEQQGDAVAALDGLQQKILDRDSPGLIALIQRERADRAVGLMGVADASGVILGRTMSPGKLGANVFLSSPGGRALAAGRSFQSFELTSFYHQIFFTTGRPVVRGGVTIGALFANYLADDAFARRFREAHLSPGAEVAFYGKEFGVYGSSFTSPEVARLVSSYFNVGSGWLGQGLERDVEVDGGGAYVAVDVPIAGLEGVPGGAILFVPRPDLSWLAAALAVLLAILCFLSLAWRRHRCVPCEVRGRRYYGMLISTAVVVAALVAAGLSLRGVSSLRLERVAYPLYNATIHLEPESGVFDVGFEQRLTVALDTGDEAINAAQVLLRFDPEAVEVKAFDSSGGDCTHLVDSHVDTAEGTALFSCVILGRGQRGHSLVLGDVVVSPRRVGRFAATFDLSQTQVLAQDGLGTDVLRQAQDGSYRVEDFDARGGAATVTPVAVYSPTHPNEARWYADRVARFVWRGAPGVTYRYSLDSAADATPAEGSPVATSSAAVPVPGDGVFYFHLQATSGGPVASYRVQSDATPPTIVAIRASADQVSAGDVVRLSVDARDAGSGVQKNYYVDFGQGLFLPTGPSLFVPVVDAGDQTVTVRAYDQAGNYAEQAKVLHVGQ